MQIRNKKNYADLPITKTSAKAMITKPTTTAASCFKPLPEYLARSRQITYRKQDGMGLFINSSDKGFLTTAPSKEHAVGY